MTTVLVVGADAESSPATDRLLDLLRWVRRHHPAAELHLFLLRGGPRIHAFHALAPTTVVDWYDRRAEWRQAALVLRGPRRQRWLARAIERAATARIGRHLPPVAADVVLVSGWEALAAGSLGVDRHVPRVVLVPDGAPGGAGHGARARGRRALAGARAVLVDETGDRSGLGGAGAAPERVVVVPVAGREPAIWDVVVGGSTP